MTTPIIGRGEKPKSGGPSVLLAALALLIVVILAAGAVLALGGWLISVGAGIPFWNSVALTAALTLCVAVGSAMARRK